MSVAERQAAVVAEFNELPDWEEKYKRIIQIGKELPDLPDEKKLDQYKVKGCQSQVWLLAGVNDAGHVTYESDSDAMIVRGLVGLLTHVYSDSPPEEILNADLTFLEEAGFATHLSPSRSNGLFSMVKQIQLYAMAFATMQKAKSGGEN